MILALAIVTGILLLLQPRGGYFAFEMPALFGGFGRVTSAWTSTDRETAYFGLGLDALFIVLYCRALQLAFEMKGGAVSEGSSAARRYHAAWRLVWLVGALDFAEDAGLYALLRGSRSSSLEWLTTLCALSKFVGLTVLIGLLVASRRTRTLATA